MGEINCLTSGINMATQMKKLALAPNLGRDRGRKAREESSELLPNVSGDKMYIRETASIPGGKVCSTECS